MDEMILEMTAVTFKNTTGQRVYYYINNGRNDFGFLDPNQEVSSGNANELGDVTIVTFKLSENPNARTDWVNALDGLSKKKSSDYARYIGFLWDRFY
jgi:hypothetical protein